jgi:hypothetical protein
MFHVVGQQNPARVMSFLLPFSRHNVISIKPSIFLRENFVSGSGFRLVKQFGQLDRKKFFFFLLPSIRRRFLFLVLFERCSNFVHAPARALLTERE